MALPWFLLRCGFPRAGVRVAVVVHRGVPIGQWTVAAWDPQRYLAALCRRSSSKKWSHTARATILAEDMFERRAGAAQAKSRVARSGLWASISACLTLVCGPGGLLSIERSDSPPNATDFHSDRSRSDRGKTGSSNFKLELSLSANCSHSLGGGTVHLRDALKAQSLIEQFSSVQAGSVSRPPSASSLKPPILNTVA